MSHVPVSRRALRSLLPALLIPLFAACGSSEAPVSVAVAAPPATVAPPSAPPVITTKPQVPVAEDHAGTISNHVLISPVDGAEIPVTVFEPLEMKKGGRYPLVIYSHGWSGSRATAREFYTDNLNQRGMYVLTFDQRGFGASTGTVKAMDPDYDGQDMVAILDWAEKLPGLARFDDGRMKVGSIGGSYGGMFQYAMAGSDPEHRLRVIVPDVTPYDINEALWPGDVYKSAYGAVLLAGTLPPLGKPDPITELYFSSGISVDEYAGSGPSAEIVRMTTASIADLADHPAYAGKSWVPWFASTRGANAEDRPFLKTVLGNGWPFKEEVYLGEMPTEPENLIAIRNAFAKVASKYEAASPGSVRRMIFVLSYSGLGTMSTNRCPQADFRVRPARTGEPGHP